MPPATTRAQKPFDVIVVGATGYVGALIAEYLATSYRGNEVRWAIAGRNRAKLEALKTSLGKPAEGLTILEADTDDEDALDALTAKGRVILTTVGPYAKYGSKLVAACARSGTDYVDLAGEAPWIQLMIDTHQAQAEETGARIVPCCGFDSIPSDLGVLFLNDEVKKRTGSPCSAVRMRVMSMKGGASGGTIASMMNMAEEVFRDARVRDAMGNPFALNPQGERKGRRQPGSVPVRFDPDAKAWTAPFIMAAINTRVVHRSNAVMNYAYGRDFTYEEAMVTGGSLLGAPTALAVTGAMGAFGLAAVVPPTRALLNRFVLPKPGEGPTPEQRERGRFDLLFIGTGVDGKTYKARVTGDRDPGYGSTAKMISEAALCLNECKPGAPAGGFWTPASAMGQTLIERLRANAGLTFGMVE